MIRCYNYMKIFFLRSLFYYLKHFRNVIGVQNKKKKVKNQLVYSPLWQDPYINWTMEDNSISKYRAAIEQFNLHPTTNEAQTYLVENGVIQPETLDNEMTIVLV